MAWTRRMAYVAWEYCWSISLLIYAWRSPFSWYMPGPVIDLLSLGPSSDTAPYLFSATLYPMNCRNRLLYLLCFIEKVHWKTIYALLFSWMSIKYGKKKRCTVEITDKNLAGNVFHLRSAFCEQKHTIHTNYFGTHKTVFLQIQIHACWVCRWCISQY